MGKKNRYKRRDRFRQTADERALLERFWRIDGEPLRATQRLTVRRMNLLREFASIEIQPTGNTRAAFEAMKRKGWIDKLGVDQCFACLEHRQLIWHHIIQVQHGGSNHPRNRAAVCDDCHAKIHPWLVAPLVELPEKVFRPLWWSAPGGVV